MTQGREHRFEDCHSVACTNQGQWVRIVSDKTILNACLCRFHRDRAHVTDNKARIEQYIGKELKMKAKGVPFL